MKAMFEGLVWKRLLGMVESDEISKTSRNAGRQGKIGPNECRKDPIESVMVTWTKRKAVARNGKMTGGVARGMPTMIERKMARTTPFNMSG
jgi:hypothetical protein